MIAYNINPRVNGINGYGLGAPDYIQTVVLAANTVKTITVPDSLPMGSLGTIGTLIPNLDPSLNPTAHKKYIAIFKYGVAVPADVWVSNGETAAVPSGGGSFASSVSDLNPQAWNVKTGDILSFITPTAGGATISVSFYYLPE